MISVVVIGNYTFTPLLAYLFNPSPKRWRVLPRWCELESPTGGDFEWNCTGLDIPVDQRVRCPGMKPCQSRTGKRTPLAALRIAHNLALQGLISRREALDRIGGLDLDEIQNFRLKPVAGQMPLARGTSASTGVAIGAAVFDPQRVAQVRHGGKAVILIRKNAETSDISALSEAVALVAAEGARTSHAAVVARELGKVCVVGCEGLAVDPSGRKCEWGAHTIEEGEPLSVDGDRGEIYRGEVEVLRDRPTELLQTFAEWRASERSGLGQTA